MYLINACVLFFLVHGSLSDEQLIKPCNHKDIDCLRKTTENFLEASCAGIPDIDVKPIDPWQANSIDVPTIAGLVISLKNVKITGLKKLKIQDFKISTENKSVVLAMEHIGEVEAEVTVQKDGSTSSGKLVGNAKEILTAKYNYDLKPNDKGVEYFTVGPEQISCEINSEPEVTVDNTEASNVLWQENASEVKKLIVCSALQKAYGTVIHNLRATSKIFPKTTYFTDLL